MAKSKKDSGFGGPDLFSQVAGQLVKVQAQARDLGVCEIVESVIDAFDKKLFLSQRVILKAIYGEELDDTVVDPLMGLTEAGLMEKWVREEKCNWKDPLLLFHEQNAKRVAAGEKPKPYFKWQEITLQCGMRMGKSALVALITVIDFFKALTHPNPQDLYGIPKSSPIYFTAIASTERQALGTIFYYVKSYIEGSTFFKTMIDNKEIEVRELDIAYPAKNLIIASGHSKATSIVGRTALNVAFDELAMFSADDDHTSNAGDVYARVGKSVATFPNDGRRVALSSVKQQGDFMETLVDRNWDRQVDGCLVFNLTTFDGNPLLSKSDSSIASEYLADRVQAERDFENIRPGASSGFLLEESVKEACRDRDPQAECTYQPGMIERKIQDNASADSEERSRKFVTLDVKVKPVIGLFESVGHADAGIARDSYAFACGHGEWTPRGIKTVIDVVLEWIPLALGQGKTAKVDLENVEEILVEFAKKRRMTRCTFDGFQSEATIQRLYRENVVATALAFSRSQQTAAYVNFKNRLQSGLIVFPNHPGLVEELLHLRLINGERIDHPKNEASKIPGKIKISKDAADCVAFVDWAISRNERDFIREHGGGVPPGVGMSALQAGLNTVGQSTAHQNINWKRR